MEIAIGPVWKLLSGLAEIINGIIAVVLRYIHAVQ